jgi:hypothetical protein
MTRSGAPFLEGRGAVQARRVNEAGGERRAVPYPGAAATAMSKGQRQWHSPPFPPTRPAPAFTS